MTTSMRRRRSYDAVLRREQLPQQQYEGHWNLKRQLWLIHDATLRCHPDWPGRSFRTEVAVIRNQHAPGAQNYSGCSTSSAESAGKPAGEFPEGKNPPVSLIVTIRTWNEIKSDILRFLLKFLCKSCAEAAWANEFSDLSRSNF